MHTIVTKVYEKGPQTLSEAIKEVEKLQAAQQITSSLLPTSSVNTMSSDNDRCFQCKEVGHMARYCPHIRCYDCDNYGHVAMDCPDKILPSGTPACTAGLAPMTEAGGLLPDITATPTIRVMNTETDLDSVALNPDPMTTAIGATAATTHVGANQGHFTGLPDAISHMTEAPAPTATIVTHPTTDIPIAGIPPKMTADLAIDPENTTTNRPEDPHHPHTLHHGSLRTESINKSQLMTHRQITITQMTMTVTLMMI